MAFLWNLILIAIGLTFLIKGADFFVEGSAGLARKLKISNFVIGMTLVALGTSFPELTVSTIASLSGSADLSLSNVIGSNIANIAIILGLCGVVRGLKVNSPTLVKYDFPYVLLAGGVFFLLAFDHLFGANGAPDILSRSDGLILLLFMVIFLYYTLGSTRSTEILEEEFEAAEKEEAKEKTWKLTLYVVGGLTALILGGNFTVEGATTLARILGASETIIGLTIVAIGTSLPELMTSIVATRKGNDEIALGNILGSNILNILLILGIVAFVSPLQVSPALLFDTSVMLGITGLLFAFLYFRRRVDRLAGVVLLLCYAVYFVCIYWRETM